MNVFTIGFTRKSADHFFGLLRESGAKRVVDVRLNNVSQLAGFAKRDDLAFFLAEISTPIPSSSDNIPCVRRTGRSCATRRGEKP